MKTILVIEDDPCIRESIQDVLDLEGYQTLAAANGLIGVELALQHLPDLVLCDISMPEMDGYEVLRTLQHHPETNTIPFVFLTARTTKADLRHGMNLGADDYLPKPCSATELLRAISRRFEKQSVVQTKSEKQLESLRFNIAQFLPHELYTPLNGILGFSELLCHDYETIDRTELQEIGEAIHTSALRLHHLLKNFVLYSKLELIAHNPEQAKFLQSRTVQSPALLVQTTAKQIAERFARLPDLQLQSYADSPCRLEIGDAYLEKIVEELVNNAFKFSNAHTPVWVQTLHEPNCFLLRVTNQGRGMTSEHIAQVGAYMQFNRKHYEQQGLGLGLIISKRITELCGGSFQIQSVPGEFTTVQVRFEMV